MLTLILIYNFVLLGLVLILLLIAWRAHRWRLLVGAGAGTALIALALLRLETLRQRDQLNRAVVQLRADAAQGTIVGIGTAAVDILKPRLQFGGLLPQPRERRDALGQLAAADGTRVEVMLGKILPYVLVGFIQAILIIGIGVLLFGVPVYGSLTLLALLSTLFITTNLAIGYTFSTIAQNQLQAMQMTFFFYHKISTN